jgi:UDP-N-acetylmuramoyl-tripeptide--D-alanyl-D-alanine ligase
VVNLDDEHVRVQAARHAGPRVTYGRASRADLQMDGIEDRFEPGAVLRFRHGGRSHRVELRIGGAHAAWNALAALAGVVAAQGDLEGAIRALASVEPAPNRGRVHRLSDGTVVVNDTYNSSPSALDSVLETLKGATAAGRKVLVMGDMLELGAESAQYHRKAGFHAADAGVRLLVAVGPQSRHTVEAARKGGVGETYHLEDARAAAAEVPGWIAAGDLVVVKGSRGIRLEQVVAAILASRGETA